MNNLIVDGMINTGKTKNVIFPLVDEMIENKESFIVTDSKKEYYDMYSDKAKENGYDVKVINIKEPYHSNSIDLFELPYAYYKTGNKNEAYRILEMMIKSLYVNDINTDPFWSNSASILVLSIVSKLFEEAKQEEINFLSIYDMLTKFSKFDTSILNNYFKSSDNKAYQGASDILSMPQATRESVISVAKQILFESIIYDDTLSMINNSEINLENINSKPTALFVITSNTDYRKNILFNIILNEIYYIVSKDRKPFNIVLDNFDEYTLTHFNEMISSSSSYNVRFIIGTRDIDTVINNNGKYLLKVSDIIYVNQKEIKKVNYGKETIIENKINQITIEDKTLPTLEIKKTKSFNIYSHISSDLIKSVMDLKEES